MPSSSSHKIRIFSICFYYDAHKVLFGRGSKGLVILYLGVMFCRKHIFRLYIRIHRKETLRCIFKAVACRFT